jgi:hypothetical protein
MTGKRRIGPVEFEQALGLQPGRLDDRTRDLLADAALHFAQIDSAGQAKLEAEIAQQISRGFTVVGEHRAEIWRDVWREQLEIFKESNYNLESLNPKFFKGSAILRWQGEYIQSVSDGFQLTFFEILRDWLFRTYLSDIDHLYEFGSGSAFNVAAYARLYPDVPITALDWAPTAVRIADLLHEKLGMKVKGLTFDFFAQQQELALAPGSGVLTMCALEQTSERFGPFLDYLLANRPRRVVHMEPTVELYAPDLPHDVLATQYHKQRKYLTGLLPALQRLANEGKIQLRIVRRLRFGSRFHECFTVIVWDPM